MEYFDIGTPVDNNEYLGRLSGASYGIPPTPSKGKADVHWLRNTIAELPDGLTLCGQDITIDGYDAL